MNRDAVETLLQQADWAAGPSPASRVDLADRVRRLARRRHRTQTAVRVTAAAVVAIGVGLAVHSVTLRHRLEDRIVALPPPPAASPSPEEVAQLRSQLAQLQKEANDLAARIRGMTAIQEQRERLARMERAVASLESGEAVRAQMERAAFTIVYQADRMDRELGLRESALRAYREAIRLFPETPSAKIARDRLAEINTQGDRL